MHPEMGARVVTGLCPVQGRGSKTRVFREAERVSREMQAGK